MSTSPAPKKGDKFPIKGLLSPKDIFLDLVDKRGFPYARTIIRSISNFKPGSQTHRTIMAYGGKQGGNLKYIEPLLREIVQSGQTTPVEIYCQTMPETGALRGICISDTRRLTKEA